MTTGLMAWHYTIGQRFLDIFASGELRPATSGIEAHERPLVWFSTNQVWEETANKMIVDDPEGQCLWRCGTKETTRKYGGGLFRLGMPARLLIPWPKVARLARMRREVQYRLERMDGNPLEWCGRFEPVPLGSLVVQRESQPGVWEPIQPVAMASSGGVLANPLKTINAGFETLCKMTEEPTWPDCALKP